MDMEQIKPLVKSLNLNDTSSRMYFLTGLGGAIRKYPDEAFPTPESRQNLLQSVQDYLDEVILEEDH
jgi:type III secretion system TyeA family effector delivery regulator